MTAIEMTMIAAIKHGLKTGECWQCINASVTVIRAFGNTTAQVASGRHHVATFTDDGGRFFAEPEGLPALARRRIKTLIAEFAAPAA